MSIPTIFAISKEGRTSFRLPKLDVPESFKTNLPENLKRIEPAKLPQVSELDVVRHYTKLSTMAFGVDNGFYPLGSCTMKYNPKVNEVIASLDGFTSVHPLQDTSTVQGCLELMYDLLGKLSAITGMDWGTLQPCAGAHGEYTGLKIIRNYFLEKKEVSRTKILVPESAHGTNPASAAVNGFEVVQVLADKRGLVDLADLKSKLGPDIAGIMLTNPSTLGLFEQDILEIAKLVHETGGLLYYDGANLNAILGKARPGDMGFDVVHLNLHKTFATPHGGGGPGSGPVLVKKDLVPFIPSPDVIKKEDGTYDFDWTIAHSIGKVSTFWGNFLVFLKAYAFILSMGKTGLRECGEGAVLNANYILARLKDAYEVPYGNKCMHEFVMSLSKLKEETSVTAIDVAKGLLDRGYHPPTMYFPMIVHEALMIEPTESEAKETLDAFCDAMLELHDLAYKDAQKLHNAPETTVIGRVDEVMAAKNPILHE